MKRVLVCGAGGFVGGHLVKALKDEGCFVRGVDLKWHEHAKTKADEFLILDLRKPINAYLSMSGGFDEVYQLAADMGGMGFIHSAEYRIMRNNMLINLNMIDAAQKRAVGRYFFSSSVCIYRDMDFDEPFLTEGQAYPALPHNEYGWEKLYSERVAQTVARNYNLTVRIARFENTYGPLGTWCGGREKAPAALCRKAAMAPNSGEFDVWGDGTAVRSYTYVDDLVAGIIKLMRSGLEGPVNLGSNEYVPVSTLVDAVIAASGKDLRPHWIEGPVGVHSRNFSKRRAMSIGAECLTPLAEGIKPTYDWIAMEVEHERCKA